MLMVEGPLRAIQVLPVHSRVDQALKAWANYMRSKEGPDGLPEQACGGIENYSTLDRDSDGAYERLDIWTAEHTQEVIEDIGKRSPAQKAALYRAYDISAVFRFPRDNYKELLVEAKIAVAIGLRRRGVWLGE